LSAETSHHGFSTRAIHAGQEADPTTMRNIPMVRALTISGLVLALLLPATLLRADDPTKAGDKDGEKMIFEDPFDSKLAKEWSWLREDPKTWRIGKEGLEIRVLPGHGTQRKNILLRPAP
jgi:hypothetical protein